MLTFDASRLQMRPGRRSNLVYGYYPLDSIQWIPTLRNPLPTADCRIRNPAGSSSAIVGEPNAYLLDLLYMIFF